MSTFSGHGHVAYQSDNHDHDDLYFYLSLSMLMKR